jgi:hypothetical protein
MKLWLKISLKRALWRATIDCDEISSESAGPFTPSICRLSKALKFFRQNPAMEFFSRVDPVQPLAIDCFRDAKSGETVRPFPSLLLRQIHLSQQRFEARVAIEGHQRHICFDNH